MLRALWKAVYSMCVSQVWHAVWKWTGRLYQLLPNRLSSPNVFANSCFGPRCHPRQIPSSFCVGTCYYTLLLGGFYSLHCSVLPPAPSDGISNHFSHRGWEAAARNHCPLTSQKPLQYGCGWDLFPLMKGRAGCEILVLTGGTALLKTLCSRTAFRHYHVRHHHQRPQSEITSGLHLHMPLPTHIPLQRKIISLYHEDLAVGCFYITGSRAQFATFWHHCQKNLSDGSILSAHLQQSD